MNTDNNNNRRHCFLTDPQTRASYQRRYRRIFLFGAAAAAEFPEDAPGRGSEVSDGAETEKMLKCEPVSARSRPDDVEEGLGRRDDVERHRHGQAFSEVAEVELGASKLPLHVGVVL